MTMSRPCLAPEGLEVDVLRHDVHVDGVPIDLTATEFGILAALVRDRGVVVSRASLVDLVFGPAFAGEHQLVDVHVASLRRKLGDDGDWPSLVETVRGLGYRVAHSE
jgi:DNA-binding response OmpR family regulator